MAAGLGQLALRKTGQEIFNKYNCNQFVRSYAASTNKRKARSAKNAAKFVKRIDSVVESIKSKGFLRSIKSYNPPENVNEKITNICSSLKLPTTTGYCFTNLEEKFKILDACFKDFKHAVPNSEIREIKSIDDVIKFYETPVDTTIPFDAMKNIELPENLHIQYDYVRFHPETDTMFGGQTAFPKSSTLVTGLKYRDKYPGHIAKRSWP